MLAHVRFACAWVEQRNAFNSVGAAIAPVVVVHFILTSSATTLIPAAIAETVVGPYVAVAIVDHAFLLI